MGLICIFLSHSRQEGGSEGGQREVEQGREIGRGEEQGGAEKATEAGLLLLFEAGQGVSDGIRDPDGVEQHLRGGAEAVELKLDLHPHPVLFLLRERPSAAGAAQQKEAGEGKRG